MGMGMGTPKIPGMGMGVGMGTAKFFKHYREPKIRQKALVLQQYLKSAFATLVLMYFKPVIQVFNHTDISVENIITHLFRFQSTGILQLGGGNN